MKKRIFTLMFILAAALCGFAQDRNNEDEVVKIDFMNHHNAVEGEIIVKFADKSSFNLEYDRSNKLQSTGMSSVDKAFEKFNVTSIKQLCPSDEKKRSFRTSKSYNGMDVVERDLSRLCLVKVEPDATRAQDADYNIHALSQELIDTFNEMEEVEFAEPNYIMYALGVETPSLQDTETPSYNETRDPGYKYFGYKTYRKEPYYSQQWGIEATNIDGLWQAYEDGLDETPNTERPIIAILDTGVDITHPDLEANIWTNPNEISNGSDDDSNGFKDDLHGWDFVNKTGDMRDYNSHGTHCAGIAAAVGTNGKGVVGANPNAYIMPVTVMQSNGTGAISTLIEGIGYAKNNGADIISMSIGTYAYSIALEQALAQAYQNSVLVASAGNDGLNIDDRALCASPYITDMPCYPAAFTFVLGVEATQKNGLANFSNYDCDGPSYSAFSEEQLYNYELQAPGTSIISTVPNGQYKYFNGTSMACPLVAGGISALMTAKDYPSQEMLWGDLINYSGNHVDFLACYEAGPAPAQLQMVTYQLTDEEGDNDGRPDAGETMYLYPTLRTTWGAAEDITYWLEFAEYEDDRTIEFIENDNIEFGHNLSAYAKSKAVNPVKLKIADDVVDGRYIKLVLKATCPNAEGIMEYPFEIQVENGVELKGLIDEDMTLSPNVHYIVTETLGVTEGTTLTILPGTVIKFKDGVALHNNGKIVAKGEPGNMITFTKTDLGVSYYDLNLRHNDTLSYCIIEYANIKRNTSSTHYFCFEEGDEEYEYFNEVLKKDDGSFDIQYNKTCLIDNCILRYNTAIASLNINNSNIVYNNAQCVISSFDIDYSNKNTSYYYHPSVICASNNIIENYYNSSNNSFYSNSDKLGHILLGNVYSNYLTDYSGNVKSTYNIGTTGNEMIKLSAKGTYLGSSNDDIISTRIYDINSPNHTTLNDIDASTAERRPAELAHGIVWKVLVNGKDAQDEFEEVVPLGVGRHKFEIYFNRPMNTSVTPMVAMGVRPPYTQNAIASDGSWNADSTIYTVYLDLDASSVTDGLNRIYVANAEDNEFFEIPFENKRFNVQVAAAGSMSTGFEATAGIGKIELKWENDSTYFNDHLGWNMYRYQKNERGNTDTILINKEMITDTLFTDFDVVPGERYYYYYKTLRTNLTESEASRNVSTVPLTAQPGDANGSLKVDVADIVTVVSFITGESPQPFVFGAADVNGDGEIDVMDIVRIINIIVAGKSNVENNSDATAKYSIVDGILYVDTPVELAGVQVYFNCNDSDIIEPLMAMDDFEQVGQFVNDGRYMFMAYSLSGAKLAPGKHAILRINGAADLDDMILADAFGANVLAIEETLGVENNEMIFLNAAYPNPFSNSITIPYIIGSNEGEVRLSITNVMGQEVANVSFGRQSRGEYKYEWQPKSDAPTGIYIINMYVNGNMMHREKVVYMK